MAIKLKVLRIGRSAPVVTCDHCSALIRDAEMALCAWERQPTIEGAETAALFFHKRCFDRFENVNSEIPYATMELNQFFRRIILNASADATTDEADELLDHL